MRCGHCDDKIVIVSSTWLRVDGHDHPVRVCRSPFEKFIDGGGDRMNEESPSLD